MDAVGQDKEMYASLESLRPAISVLLAGRAAGLPVGVVRALARKTDYSHTTLAAMAAGYRPVTVRGLLAFLAGCRVTTFAERIAWLDLLERTSDSPRRRLDAARERARLEDLSDMDEPRAFAKSAPRQPPARPAWRRPGAVQVDLPLLNTDLRALRRHYGPRFLTVLAQHTGIPSKTLSDYMDEKLRLNTSRTNLLAAAVLRMGQTPPSIERLPHVLPRMVAGRPSSAPPGSLTAQAAS
jgi:hypothetical protein